MSESLRAQLTEHCLNLLRIPSETGNEKAIADHVENWARNLVQVDPDDIVRVGNGVVVGTPDEKPCIGLIGHLDTVPKHPGDGDPHQDGDKLVGLGASDMKCSLAVMQCLAENLDLEELPFSMMFVFYDREEGDYDDNGLQDLLEQWEPVSNIDLAIVMEPTNNTLQLGCLGGLQAKVIFRGKAAHSARPWQGENAIHKSGRLLNELTRIPVQEISIQGLTFSNCINATMAQGGRARNVIPENFELNINYRFAPTEPIQQATKQAVDHLKELVGKDADLDIYDISPPGPVPTDNPILDHIRRTVDLQLKPKQAWTDVARLAAHGVDALNFGPGFGHQAHQEGEWASLDEMERAYNILKEVFTTFPSGWR